MIKDYFEKVISTHSLTHSHTQKINQSLFKRVILLYAATLLVFFLVEK